MDNEKLLIAIVGVLAKKQIRDEYNRLTAYDFEMKETDEGVEVKTNWLE